MPLRLRQPANMHAPRERREAYEYAYAKTHTLTTAAMVPAALMFCMGALPPFERHAAATCDTGRPWCAAATVSAWCCAMFAGRAAAHALRRCHALTSQGVPAASASPYAVRYQPLFDTRFACHCHFDYCRCRLRRHILRHRFRSMRLWGRKVWARGCVKACLFPPARSPILNVQSSFPPTTFRPYRYVMRYSGSHGAQCCHMVAAGSCMLCGCMPRACSNVVAGCAQAWGKGQERRQCSRWGSGSGKCGKAMRETSRCAGRKRRCR